jgi:hypothetical protein
VIWGSPLIVDVRVIFIDFTVFLQIEKILNLRPSVWIFRLSALQVEVEVKTKPLTYKQS